MTPFIISEVLREILLHVANPCELSGAYLPVISMYLKCLGDQEIKSLLNQGIDISLMSDYNQMQLGIENKKPMFNYPGFLRILYYEQMISAVENWCAELADIMEQKQQPDCHDDFIDEENKVTLVNNAEEIIMKTLLQLCMKHGSRLYGLHINPDTLDKSNDEMYEILLTDDNLKNLVSPSVDSFGEAITSLISSQNALISFSLTSCKAYTRVFIPPLRLHSSTLRYIRFDRVNFKGCDPWYSIAECRNIELLEVFQCANLEEEMVGPVTKARFGNHFEVRYVSAHNNNKTFRDWANKVSGSVVGNICGERLNIGNGILALLSA
ncbi:21424_t:CDS:2 [Cetraspora pellucida]|uniref:21424_t:CDS:1 n=1 Tax=Cetraspora pellucida TaxID=1433469 RepID=A0A9N9CFX3_9GLOM|nr:21424_t:CDS:2 [Cetraspora pellucida]